MATTATPESVLEKMLMSLFKETTNIQPVITLDALTMTVSVHHVLFATSKESRRVAAAVTISRRMINEVDRKELSYTAISIYNGLMRDIARYVITFRYEKKG